MPEPLTTLHTQRPIAVARSRQEKTWANARAALGDAPCSHEVVPLGTQEALIDLIKAAAFAGDTVAAGAAAADSPIGRLARVHVRVAALVEGVERTPTPEPLVPGAAARADALACSRCGGLPAGEASGAGDLCSCAPEPSSSGITDEQVEAAAVVLAGPARDPGEWPSASHRAHARKILAAAFELQAGERTHTLVPNEVLYLAANAVVSTYIRQEADRPNWRKDPSYYARGSTPDDHRALANALEAAARGEHPVQWPGEPSTEEGR